MESQSIREYYATLDARSQEFEAQIEGGRGESYNRAQTDPTVRREGMRKLVGLLHPSEDVSQIPATWVILDALAGDGTVSRCLSGATRPLVICGDIARLMVVRAMEHGLPAVRQ